MKRDRPPKIQRVERHERHFFLQISGERHVAVGQKIRATRVQRLDGKSQRCTPCRGTDRGSLKSDAVAETVLGDRTLEQIGVRVERLERVDPPFGTYGGRHLHSEETDVSADIDGGITRLQQCLDESDLILLVVPAKNVQADGVVRQIDEESHAARDLLDHHRRIVRVGKVRILPAELGRSDEVMAELRGVSRAGELRADDILALGIAIQQQPIGPDDMIAGQSARMV